MAGDGAERRRADGRCPSTPRRRRPRPRCGGRGSARRCRRRRRGRRAAAACPRRRSATPTASGSSTSVIDGSNWASPTRTNERRSSTALPLNAVHRERLEDVGDGGRLEHDLVAARRQLDRVRRGVRLGRGPGAEDGAVEVGEATGAWRATPSAPSRRAMPAMPTRRSRASTAWPAELANAPVQWFVRQYPAVSSPPAASTKSRTIAPGRPAWRRASPGRPGADRPAGAGGATPGQPGSSGASAAAASDAVDEPARPSSPTTVDEPAGGAAVDVDADADACVDVLGDVLVDHRVGEAGQRQLGCGRRDTSTSAPGDAAASRARATSPRAPPASSAAHARTPTRTLRNRAGAAGWPVWPIWPGWPLPQFGVPQATVSDDSMSIERQNCGPMPV